MATDWNKLRAINGSQEKGFEELCCQLAAGEPHLAGSKFVRKGTPDAGVECFWTLPNSDEEGWQAKYFLGPPTSGQWTQIDDSVKTALEKHPRLKRYVVCIPIDRSDRRHRGEKTLLDRWNDRVVTWKKWAAKKKMSVEFEFWGDHELTARLNREENRGRHWFWFATEQFTLAWFRETLAVAIRNADERYTPAVHVELPIASHFAALGRTPAFYAKVNALYTKLREAADRFVRKRPLEQMSGVTSQAETIVAAISKHLDDALLAEHDPPSTSNFAPMAWETIAELARPLGAALNTAAVEMRKSLWEKKAEPPGTDAEKVRTAHRAVQEACWACDEFAAAVDELVGYAAGEEAVLSNRPALLLSGEAGQGKTHLLCDVAERDMQADRPRVLLHGSHFVEGEPWGQVVRLLGLNCSAAELLGALDAAGQAYRSRVVVLIDALNEGPGRGIWQKHLAGMLERVANKPGIGLAVSVRRSYEELVIPLGVIPAALTRVIHEGFAEHEQEAVHRYFVHYGIQPTMPVLVPEFSNPLFLKLFCQGVRGKGWTQVPVGIRGITAILDMLLDATNRRLSVPDKMDYDRTSDPVRRATDAVVGLMAERGEYYLPRAVALEAVNAVHPVAGHDKSLFRNLVSEGILTENRWRVNEGYEEVVSIAYERFADHLLARHLLGENPTAEAAKRAFGARGRLQARVKDRLQAERNAGLIEALSVQLPERVGKELFELAPKAAHFFAVQRGFVNSLAWRASDAFSKATSDKINALLGEGFAADDILNAVVTLGPVPGHPLNGDKLHRILSRPSMAERDAWWSTFLHHEWYRNRSVVRLVAWVTDTTNLSSLSDEVVMLTGTTLGWCFSTPNRFLRDRATKALARLFENRLEQLPSLLEKFWGVNDPYVVERMVAAAYGSAMRSQREPGLRELAVTVHHHVFQAGKLLPQLLTRDYARGIVDLSRQRGVIKRDECLSATPPSKSDWPQIAIPSAEELEPLGEWTKDMPQERWALHDLYTSVMENGSDFSRYVVGDMDEWTTVRLGDAPSKSVKQQVDDFLARLTKAQRKAVSDYQTVFRNVGMLGQVGPSLQRKVMKRTFTKEELEAVLADAEQAVEKSLARRSAADLDFFRQVVKPFTAEPHKYRRADLFDGELARRWMFRRTLDYGWTVDRFGRFDRSVRHHDAGRSDHKPERIGKKYQWIAYRELLARLSDNFHLRTDRYSDDGKLAVCAGPWEIGGGFKRDIDPSILVRTTPRADVSAGHAWWAPVQYSEWHAGGSELGWLKQSSDLPSIEPLLGVRGSDGSNWLVLDTHLEWRAPARPGRKEYDRPQNMIWYIIRSFLVRKADATKFFPWAKKQDFMGRWMPEPPDVYHSYLGECYWSRPFAAETSETGLSWSRDRSAKLPCEVLVTSFDHVTESKGRDCSVDESFHIRQPTPALFKGMGMRTTSREGEFVDSEGQVIAFDPSVRARGPGALLLKRDQLVALLEREELQLVWTLLGEKHRIGGDDPSSLGWLQVSGAYRLGKKGIEGKCTAEYRIRAQ